MIARVHLIELGPAHTHGDAIAHVPDASVVFTGDILFIEGTPMMWAGPVSNWLTACDRIIELDAGTIVPGHGPVTDDVRRARRAALPHLRPRRGVQAVRRRHGREAAADDIDISDFRDWGDPERIAANVATAVPRIRSVASPLTPPEMFVRMAKWSARH